MIDHVADDIISLLIFIERYVLNQSLKKGLKRCSVSLRRVFYPEQVAEPLYKRFKTSMSLALFGPLNDPNSSRENWTHQSTTHTFHIGNSLKLDFDAPSRPQGS
jgi:hypothetical protein